MEAWLRAARGDPGGDSSWIVYIQSIYKAIILQRFVSDYSDLKFECYRFFPPFNTCFAIFIPALQATAPKPACFLPYYQQSLKVFMLQWSQQRNTTITGDTTRRPPNSHLSKSPVFPTNWMPIRQGSHKFPWETCHLSPVINLENSHISSKNRFRFALDEKE